MCELLIYGSHLLYYVAWCGFTVIVAQNLKINIYMSDLILVCKLWSQSRQFFNFFVDDLSSMLAAVLLSLKDCERYTPQITG